MHDHYHVKGVRLRSNTRRSVAELLGPEVEAFSVNSVTLHVSWIQFLQRDMEM